MGGPTPFWLFTNACIVHVMYVYIPQVVVAHWVVVAWVFSGCTCTMCIFIVHQPIVEV